jgi:hypothetical protein
VEIYFKDLRHGKGCTGPQIFAAFSALPLDLALHREVGSWEDEFEARELRDLLSASCDRQEQVID